MSSGVAAQLAQAEREIFARRPEHRIEPTLERIAALVTLMGDPHRACPVIHVTGTNGKTSTAHMIEALLRARGLRTGLFTSPHLASVRERIRVDGEPLPPERFLAAYHDVAPFAVMVDERQPAALSFFEVLTAMAFAAFADAPVDVMVLEVGLGGQWDATNVADGAVAVITTIALDHMKYLGPAIADIAGEKAGIIKPGAVAVLGAQRPEAAAVLLRRAAEVGAAEVLCEGVDFGVAGRELAVGGQRLTLRAARASYEDVALPLFGGYQAANAACALAAVEAFTGAAPGETGELDAGLVRSAFAEVAVPGRLEVVRRAPVVIVDSAHNPAGMSASVAALTEAFGFGSLTAVVAISADKDVAGLLAELEPVADELVVTGNSSGRALGVAELADQAAEVFGGDRVRAAASLPDALELAVGLADEAEAARGPGTAGVLVTGSVYTAGEARALLRAPATVDAS